MKKEISELFEDSLLDKNGEVTNGSGISPERKQYMIDAVKVDQKENGGFYGLNDYRFWYDWRLDPLYTVDLLNEYIQQVKAITGCSKVSIQTSCIGSIITTTYVAKYGVIDIHGIGYTSSVVGVRKF